MARRRRGRTSPVEDLLAIASALPWWVSIVIAAVAYVVIHSYAIDTAVVKAAPGHVGATVVSGLWHALAKPFQYIIPGIFILGALISFVGRLKRQGLAKSVAGSGSDAVNNMSWKDFELLVGEAFRQRGYTVTETGGGGADGGIDIVLKKGSEVFLVQCKQWRAYKVSVNIVRELFGAMAAQHATGGFVVTSGVFTQDAKDFASGRNIDLIDGAELEVMIKGAKAIVSVPAPVSSQPSATVHATVPAPESSKPNTNYRPPVAPPITTPACPQCGSAMIKRTATKGAHIGKLFWGCSTYPSCKGVHSL